MPTDPSQPAPNPLGTPEPWNLVSDTYTAEVLPQFTLYSREALQLAELPDPAQIVDVACGPGTLALMAAAQGARVCALDFSPAMIRNLEKRARESGLAGVDIRLGDGQALPFEDASFDGAFSMFGLMFFPDRQAGFRELLRVLRPGRRAVVSSWAPMEGAFARMMDATRAMLPFLPPAGKFPLSDPEDFLREMREAGFRETGIHVSAHPMRYATAEDFWQRVQRTAAPLVMLRRKLGEQEWARVSARVGERLRADLGAGAVETPGLAYLGTGIR